MFSFKRWFVGILCFGLSFSYAGTLGLDCEASEWTATCEKTAYGIGARALYLQVDTTSPQSSMVYQQNQTLFPMGISPVWGWAFEIFATYRYHTGNDMTLSWSHLRSGNNHNNLNRVLNLYLPSANSGQSSDEWIIRDLRHSIYPSWDQVNVEWGQHIDVEGIKGIRMHGGINFSRVFNSGTQDFDGTNVTTATIKQTKNAYDMSYGGFGPRLGLDLNYDWANGLNIYAKGAISVLAGFNKSSYFYNDLVDSANSYVYSLSIAKALGELDAKLGVQYNFDLSGGELSVDAGWLWAQYSNPLLGSEHQNLAKPINYGFGLQGVYLGIQWLGVLI